MWVPIDVPPLRDRDGDIDLLAEHFLASFDGGGRTFSSEAMDELKKYQWPGNIRQFRNVVQRISVMSDDRVVPAEAVILALEGEMQFNRISADPVLIPFEGMSLGEAKDAFERQLILQKLEETGYNITKAAQLLGIYPSNLHNKIRKYGIETKK
jgi:two-component system nitrogen regulation response regulator NtrX